MICPSPERWRRTTSLSQWLQPLAPFCVAFTKGCITPLVSQSTPPSSSTPVAVTLEVQLAAGPSLLRSDCWCTQALQMQEELEGGLLPFGLKYIPGSSTESTAVMHICAVPRPLFQLPHTEKRSTIKRARWTALLPPLRWCLDGAWVLWRSVTGKEEGTGWLYLH